jgi:hypothetical protein
LLLGKIQQLRMRHVVLVIVNAHVGQPVVGPDLMWVGQKFAPDVSLDRIAPG